MCMCTCTWHVFSFIMIYIWTNFRRCLCDFEDHRLQLWLYLQLSYHLVIYVWTKFGEVYVIPIITLKTIIFNFYCIYSFCIIYIHLVLYHTILKNCSLLFFSFKSVSLLKIKLFLDQVNCKFLTYCICCKKVTDLLSTSLFK